MHYMKGRLLVMLNPDESDFDAALEATLEPHRLDEDAEVSPSYYWDYWHLTSDPFGELQPARQETTIDGRCARNSRIVGELHDEYLPSAVITPDGEWNDLSEHGWRLIDDPCESNANALHEWEVRFSKLRAKHFNMVGVEVLYHC